MIYPQISCPLHHYRCLQGYGWQHINSCILCQALLNLVEEKYCLNSNTRIPFCRDFGGQYMNAQVHPLMIDLPTFNAAGLSEATSPEFSVDWAADASKSGNCQGTVEQVTTLSYDVSAHRAKDTLQEADPINENFNVHCTEQSLSFAELSLAPNTPDNIPSISVVEHLEQSAYGCKQSTKGTQAGPIYFNGELGVSLGSLATLMNGNSPAFDRAADIGEKASVRFKLTQFTERSVQARVRRGNKGQKGRPITLREMGEMVFSMLRKLMDDAERCGNPLQHGGSRVDIEKVVVLRVDQVSKGSIQPILGIRSKI